MNNIYLTIVFSILMLPGIVGIILPVLPGIPYMFIIALIYGIADKFVHLSWGEYIVLAIIAVTSLLVDYFSGVLGARYGGASKNAYIWGLGGLIIGLITLPPFGGLAGLFVGIFLGEYLLHNDKKKAAKAASGGLVGQVAGMLLNLILAILFLISFIVMAIKI